MIRTYLKKFFENEIDLDRKVTLLELENGELKRKLQNAIPVIDPGFDDPIPRNLEERRRYVSRYAEIHEELIEPKLRHLIAVVREHLDSFGWEGLPYDNLPQGMSRGERDAFFRGTSNAFRLLLEYGDQMKSEMMSYITNNDTKYE